MHELKPTVELINCSGDERLIYNAARRCYSSAENWTKLWEREVPEERRKKLIRDCIKSGHYSILEHVAFTWHVTCSRACSHQLVRKRIATYSQQSQRYVEMADVPFIMPDFLYLGDNRDKAELIVYRIMRNVQNAYVELEALGAKKEDARCVLTQASATQVIFTMNASSLLNFFEHRCCNRAQKEIREIANTMLAYCKLTLPTVFENAGPKCIREKRCSETNSCGLKPWKTEVKS